MFDFLPAEAKKQIRRRGWVGWLNPMLATLTRKPFSDPDWLFETKLDGIRCLAYRKGDRLELFSRNKLRLNEEFPDFTVPLLKRQPATFILDGEIVAMEHGVSRFSLLQRRKQKRLRVFFYVFDVFYLNGYDVTGLPLQFRKEILRRMFSFEDPLRLCEYRDKDGEKYYREACRKGWEGIIAKRRSSPYVHRRSLDWLKIKCENQQEFVIVGYTDPQGQRIGIGALLVGVYEGGKLKYAGKVGTGFDTETLKMLKKKLSVIEVPTCPCSGDSLPRGKVHWLRPKYVAQIAFTEWTSAGKLRHPRFLGLRMDKSPSEVVRELS